jgi:hypothetical protein
VLNQNVAPNVDASNHSKPIKRLFILFIICLLLYHICDKVKSIMIEQDDIFDEVKDNLGLWCAADCSGADLAAAAGMAISNKLRAVSVPVDAVAPIWAWLENTKVAIYSRFYVDKDIDDNFMSDLSSRISASFRDGADGAIIFIRMCNLENFAKELAYIRDDLFFNKTLAVGLDINEIDYADWESVFKIFKTIRADALTLFLSRDDGDKSDFVGRVYAMLNADWGDWRGALQFVAGQNTNRMDEMYRLVEQLKIDRTPTMLFWVDRK